MPPLRPTSPSSSSDSEAPETYSLSHSQKSIQHQNALKRKAEEDIKRQTRLKNRERDKMLKEGAFKKKEKEKQSVDYLTADEEGDRRKLHSKPESTNAEEEQSNSDDASMNSSFSSQQQQIPQPTNYLPDELFKLAFSQSSKPPPPPKPKTPKTRAKKNRNNKTTPKDIIIGSKAIRTITTSSKRPIPPNTAIPSSKINKFLNRSLAYKKAGSTKNWERRPANIGILRRNGPASHFVRNS